MTQPNPREITEVSKLEALQRREVATLRSILALLGFDTETIALAWEKTEDFVSGVFENGRGMTGKELAEVCQIIHLRPGVVQEKLNFDETSRRLTRQGRSSTPVPARWVGPPRVCLEGDRTLGTFFRDAYVLEGMCSRIPKTTNIDTLMLKRIASGKAPILYQWIRDVVPLLRTHYPDYHRLKQLERLLRSFPPGIRTVDDVFSASDETSQTITEAPMGREMFEFIERCRANNVGPDVHLLIETCSLYDWVEELLEWDGKKVDRLKRNDDGVTRAALELFIECMSSKILPLVAQEALERLQSFLSGEPKRKKTALPVPRQKAEGKHGETWLLLKNQVRINGRTYQVTGDSDKSLPQLFFAVLNQLRRELKFESWAAFTKAIGTDYDTVLTMSQGTWVANADRVDALLLGVRKAAETDTICLEHLCGAKQIEFSKPTSKPKMLFEPGDRKTATSWVLTLRKYRQVRMEFRKTYGLTDADEADILTAKRSVPLAVHHYLLYLIEQRLSRVSNPKLPRAYQALLKMPESQFDPEQFGELDAIPHKDWLKR